MAKKHFYSDIVDTESLILALSEMDLTDEQREHLLDLIDASLHHVVLDAVLSELSDEDKKIFLEHLISDDHDRVWNLLHTRIEKIEEKIQKVAEDLKKELHADIDEAKK